MRGFGIRNLLLAAVVLTMPESGAETIGWTSSIFGVNHTSSGQDMDAAFQFQLGAFSGGFIPTAFNLSEWDAHWVPAQTTPYDTSVGWYNSVYESTSNAAPFTAGGKAYVRGRRQGAGGDEWILFRKGTWLWPVANPPVSSPPDPWGAADADDVVLGIVNPTGAPFLMKSAAVYTFAQWRSTQLAGEPLNGPADDPDRDGVPNLLEFVFGTSPVLPGPPVQTPVTRVGGYLQITIPRLANRLAKLTVEVSPDLVTWSSGTLATTVVQSSATSLVVRDLTPLDSSHPKRFVRLKVEPATP